MAECFCGCGRNVRRGFNKQGRRAVGLVAKLRDARDRIEQREGVEHPRRTLMALSLEDRLPPEAGDSAENWFRALEELLDELIDEGEDYAAFWQSLAHDEYIGTLEMARGEKKAFERWGGRGMALCRAIGVPVSRIGTFTGEV